MAPNPDLQVCTLYCTLARSAVYSVCSPSADISDTSMMSTSLFFVYSEASKLVYMSTVIGVGTTKSDACIERVLHNLDNLDKYVLQFR